MKLPGFKQTTRQNQPELPPFWDAATKGINDQLKSITDCLSKRVSAADNLDADIRTIRITHGTPFELAVNVKSRAIGVALIDSGGLRCESPVFQRVADKTCRVTVFFLPSDPGREIEVTLLFFGG